MDNVAVYLDDIGHMFDTLLSEIKEWRSRLGIKLEDYVELPGLCQW